jgi:hypothetical protein
VPFPAESVIISLLGIRPGRAAASGEPSRWCMIRSRERTDF